MPLDNPDFPPAAGHRFHVPPDSWSPSLLTLAGPESRHCAEILRHRPGDRVTAFDGHGREATCEITSVSKREVALEIISQRLIPRPAFDLVLAQAIAKSKAMDWLVQKATEIGATRIIPLTTERSVVRIKGATDAAKHREKWGRIALETAKQCSRAWLPEIADPQSLGCFLGSLPHSELRLIAALDPATQPLRSALSPSSPMPISATVLIGPEGDFTPAELAAARAARFLPVSLGPNILRSETAALYTLSVLAFEFGTSPPLL